MEIKSNFSKISEKIKTYKLSNSFPILFYEDKRLPIVAINIAFHTGSKDEKEGETGYAHLFEHLMFQGSLNFPNDYFKSLEKYGASINGGTSEDKTVYWEVIPKGAIDYTLSLESDRIKNLFPFVNEERLKNQIDVVKNEKRQVIENEPYGIADEAISEIVFPEGHPYRHPVIGFFEDIDRATIEKMESFFKKFYVPRNGAIAICGDFDRERTLNLLEKLFGSIDEGKYHPPLREWVPEIKGKRNLVVQSNVVLKRNYYLFPIPNFFSKKEKDIYLLTKILSRGKDAPLQKRLMIENPLCQSVSASLFSGEVCGLFYVVATLRNEKDEEKVEEIIFEEIEKLRKGRLEEEELESIFTGIQSSMIRNMETLGGFGGLSDFLNHYQLFYGDPKYFERDYENLFGIKGEEITKSTKELISVEDYAKLTVKSHTKKIVDINVNQNVEIKNGFSLNKWEKMNTKSLFQIFYSREETLPFVTHLVAFKCGSNEDPLKKEGLCEMVVDMFEEGAKGRSNLEISKELKSVGAFYETQVGADDIVVKISLPSKFSQKGAQLLSEIFFNPDFPENEIERVKSLKISSLKKDLKDPYEVGRRVSMAILYGKENPYGKPTSGRISTIEGMKRGDILNFYEEKFTQDRGALFSIGEFEEEDFDEIKKNSNNLKKFSSSKGLISTKTSNDIKFHIVKMENFPSVEIFAFLETVDRTSVEYPALSVFNLILGGKFTSRLNKKMREERGYTYGVRTYFSLKKGKMAWFLNSTVEKESLALAISDIFTEIDGILHKNPPTEEEFLESRNGFLANYIRNFETQNLRATNFAKLFTMEFPTNLYEESYDRVVNLKLEEVIESSRKFFSKDKLTFVLVGDIREDQLKELNFGEVSELKAEDYF
jgi:predicted Zn-dependent peptidase